MLFENCFVPSKIPSSRLLKSMFFYPLCFSKSAGTKEETFEGKEGDQPGYTGSSNTGCHGRPGTF